MTQFIRTVTRVFMIHHVRRLIVHYICIQSVGEMLLKQQFKEFLLDKRYTTSIQSGGPCTEPKIMSSV